MDNYIFDLDGTIINSSEEVLNCFIKAFQKSNYPIDMSRLSSDIIGPPLKEIVCNIVPELDDEEILNTIIMNFREIYDNDTDDTSVLYDGFPEKLTELKRKGKKLFLATLKPTKPTQRILLDFNLNIFDDVYTIDKFSAHMTKTEMLSDIINKYKLDRTKTVMIGDAASDMLAAKEAGILGIGALWGYGQDKEPLRELAGYVIKTSAEL